MIGASKDFSFFDHNIFSSEFKNYSFRENVYFLGDKDQGENINFAIQWSKFKHLQLDSVTLEALSKNRLMEAGLFTEGDLVGKLVLEIGSGAGRFSEILVKMGAKVVSIDNSDAVFTNAKMNSCKNICFIRADLETLPLNYETFDYVIALGVMQHTKNIKNSIEELIKFANREGICIFDFYRKHFLPIDGYFPKYFWRPITKRMNPYFLLRIIEFYVPKWFKIHSFIKTIPKIGLILNGLLLIPIWNYTGVNGIRQEKSNLLMWAICDTFDALAPKYDVPISKRQLIKMAEGLPVKHFLVRAGGNGLILNVFSTK
jgi:ubiquinone/menaquinone biosynthesis C-methylase UbiE